MHVPVLVGFTWIVKALALPSTMSSLVLIIVGFLAANLVDSFVFRVFERPTLAVLHRFGSTTKAVEEKRLLPEFLLLLNKMLTKAFPPCVGD
jgi:hypothetical protein